MVLISTNTKSVMGGLLTGFGIEPGIEFRLDSETTLSLLACLVRRASGIIGPNSQANLTQAVLEPLRPILGSNDEEHEELNETMETVIESLTAIGDLREERAPRRQIFPGYPCFVKRRNGDVIMLGVVSETRNSVPEPLMNEVSHRGILRYLETSTGKDLVGQLGLSEISEEMWAETPINESPHDHVTRLLGALANSSQSPDGLEFQRYLNPSSAAPEKMTDYRRRWVNGIPKSATADIAVARASDSGEWFLVQVDHGEVKKCLVLGNSPGSRRACDEAWRFQFALDAVKADGENRARPVIRVKKDADSNIMKIYSPPLSWASRRWDLVGSRLTKEECFESECLFGWRFDDSEIENGIPFLEETLWHSVTWE